MKKRFVSLIEILVAISILAILLSLLLPNLSRAREEAKRAQCLSNLKNQGILTAAYAADHGGRIPSNNLTYNNAHWKGEKVNNNWFWHDFIGSYLENVTGSLLENEVYHCPSRTIADVKNDGTPINNPLTYWANPFAWKHDNPDAVTGNSRYIKPWSDNAQIRDVGAPFAKRERYTKFSQLYNPSVYASIYDTAQSNNGRSENSGGGSFISKANAFGIWENPTRPNLNAHPDDMVGYKEIPQQDGLHYDQSGIDFRHPGDTVSAVMFDGSATVLRNGGIRNENMINQ
ncbi:type II secretion system protein [Lentisphaera marina]|uniref:type II secretion system protein n=1 Tax=Lentisphaera marina TaxID=1111041 RepID=UPI0023669D88|nr:type II secretion system protein [Lentisphaera marina]MDD7986026.1 type II secretion system protein [Lentisphaera marina]